MLNWRSGWGQSAHGYICILLYKKIICSGLPEIYLIPFGVVIFHISMDWRKGVGSVCQGYRCILLYMKFFSVMVLHRSIVN